MSGTALVCYVPVLHKGYRNLFEKYRDVGFLGILGQDILATAGPPLHKDIRALDPYDVVAAVTGWDLFREVHVVEADNLARISEEGWKVILPDEDVSRAVAEKYLQGCECIFENVFLRWDLSRSLAAQEVEATAEITEDAFFKDLMDMADGEAAKSSDWWRRIGGLIVDENGNVLLIAHNEHVPSVHQPCFDGDPRMNFKKGLHIELSTADHAESCLIGTAARCGISLVGKVLVVTTFPCPPCAKLVVRAGITACYFRDGYGMLDAQSLFKTHGVAVIRVLVP